MLCRCALLLVKLRLERNSSVATQVHHISVMPAMLVSYSIVRAPSLRDYPSVTAPHRLVAGGVRPTAAGIYVR